MTILNNYNLYASLFLIGLIGSAHCIAMCGSILQIFQNITKEKHKKYSLYIYNLGRISSYILITIISMIFILNFTKQTQSLIPTALFFKALAACFMIFLGVSQLFEIKTQGFFNNFTQKIWQKIRKLVNPILPPKSLKQVYLVGIVWGFIPCSLIYSALAVAISADNLINSVIAIICFGLGTMPALIGMGFITNILNNNKTLRPTLAVFLICIGVFSLVSVF